jgi:hypothetical protein
MTMCKALLTLVQIQRSAQLQQPQTLLMHLSGAQDTAQNIDDVHAHAQNSLQGVRK